MSVILTGRNIQIIILPICRWFYEQNDLLISRLYIVVLHFRINGIYDLLKEQSKLLKSRDQACMRKGQDVFPFESVGDKRT